MRKSLRNLAVTLTAVLFCAAVCTSLGYAATDYPEISNNDNWTILIPPVQTDPPNQGSGSDQGSEQPESGDGGQGDGYSSGQTSSSGSVSSASSGGLATSGSVAEVSSFSELKEAVENGGAVTLGRDVVLSGQISIQEGKTVVINGAGYELEASGGGVILVGDGSRLQLKNITVKSRDDAGLLRAEEGKDKTILAEDVTFQGPVFVVNNASGDSRTILQDCSLNIVQGGKEAGPAIRGGWVEVYGENTIQHTAQQYPVFLLDKKADPLVGESSRGLVLRAGASLQVTTSDFLLRAEDGALYLEENAQLSASCKGGFTEGSLRTIEIGENAGADFLLSGSARGAGDRALAADSRLLMQPGSYLCCDTSREGVQEAALSVQGEVILNAPAQLLLSADTAVPAVSEKSSAEWKASGINTVNYWDRQGILHSWNDQTDTLADFDLAVSQEGKLQDVPQTVRDTHGNLLADDRFDLYATSNVLLGRYSGGLQVDWKKGQTSVSGTTAAGALVTVLGYNSGVQPLFQTSQTAENGSFSLEIPENYANANVISVLAQTGKVMVHRSWGSAEMSGSVTVQGAVLEVQQSAGLGGQSNGLRQVEPMRLKVTGDGTRQWKLYVSEVQPLNDGDSGVFFFRRLGENQDVTDTAITTEESLVAVTEAGEFTFQEEEGVYLSREGDGERTAQLRWTILNG